MFDGAPQIKIKSDSLRIVDTRSIVGAGLPAKSVRTPRFAWFPRVIVNDHRRQAGSYSRSRWLLPLLHTTQAGCQAAVLLLLILILILGAPLNTLAGIRQGFGG
ncbi:hypothetical protein CWC48_28790 [Pseudomonas sp. S10E 269]|nr:hypothetical protein CWC49_09230 [Pseudomonas sp. S09F 262]PJK42961.1 hypothetical protein CWC48_28790 [Pseudomonas sp. S10E 269]